MIYSPSPAQATAVLHAVEMFGICVAAVSGALAALRKQMDIFGLTVAAVVTSIGGGTVRDLLLDRHPIFWIARPEYLVWGAVAGLATVVYARFWRVPLQSLLIVDAITLAFFTLSGAKHAFDDGLPALIVVLMAALSGVAGGAIRDVLCGEVPKIFRGEIYATVAILGAAFFLLLLKAGVRPPLAGTLASVSIVGTRCAAVWRGWKLKPPARLPHLMQAEE